MSKSENLRKLADFLCSLPEDYDGFCMDTYQCGTSGCAAGHAPKATGIPLEKGQAWEVYCSDHLVEDHTAWCFLFDAGWRCYDNTPKGAAERIYYYLEHGVPENYEYNWKHFNLRFWSV